MTSPASARKRGVMSEAETQAPSVAQDAPAAQTDKPLNLAAKIAKIAAELGPLAKTGENKEQKYKFIENAEVSAAIRAAQQKVGVAVLPTIDNYTVSEVKSKYGALGYHYIINFTFRVVNTDNPDDCFESKWLGESTDFGDKGINKAETAGEKYFLMRLYHISDKGDRDPDADTPAETFSPDADMQQIEAANKKEDTDGSN